ncbi:hypothetical protein OOZ51_00370 [Arthrobacter sp. MI7-26]|uniref:hypothetical protein n=1 Tax=Arthrobacter sp. MI7-26 TaxID=2993653 RepID=UPI0022494271|nr:hypothetical protein [Arthrobacter sp. MI7-26]MCX2746267.1 hypothetical protein [Arthrobacter sp. MI7-26]
MFRTKQHRSIFLAGVSVGIFGLTGAEIIQQLLVSAFGEQHFSVGSYLIYSAMAAVLILAIIVFTRYAAKR